MDFVRACHVVREPSHAEIMREMAGRGGWAIKPPCTLILFIALQYSKRRLKLGVIAFSSSHAVYLLPLAPTLSRSVEFVSAPTMEV
jgi:hypothetical protein